MKKKFIYIISVISVYAVYIGALLLEKYLANKGVQSGTFQGIFSTIGIAVSILLVSSYSRLHNLFIKKIDAYDLLAGFIPTAIIIMVAISILKNSQMVNASFELIAYWVCYGIITVTFEEFVFRVLPKEFLTDGKMRVRTYILCVLLCTVFKTLDFIVLPTVSSNIIPEIFWNLFYSGFVLILYLKSENFWTIFITRIIGYLVLSYLQFFTESINITLSLTHYIIFFSLTFIYFLFIVLYYNFKYHVLAKKGDRL